MRTQKPGARRRGQMLMILALAFVPLLGMLGLAIDLGFKFALERQIQTAVDAASLAGSRALAQSYQYTRLQCQASPTAPGCVGLVAWTDQIIRTEIVNAGTANVQPYPTMPSNPTTGNLTWPTGTGDTIVAYYLITNNQNPPTLTQGVAVGSTGTIPTNAAGIRVEATLGRDALFGQVLGECCARTFARATARAVLQDGGSGAGVPFLMCGGQDPTAPTGSGQDYGAYRFNSNNVNAQGVKNVNLVDQNGNVQYTNDNVDQLFLLNSPDLSDWTDCGFDNASWKGIATATTCSPGGTNPLPCSQPIDTGGGVGRATVGLVDGGCTSTLPSAPCLGVVGLADNCTLGSNTCRVRAYSLFDVASFRSAGGPNRPNCAGQSVCYSARLRQGLALCSRCPGSGGGTGGAFSTSSTVLVTYSIVPDDPDGP
jgi:Flp pilus assembly protein TadG